MVVTDQIYGVTGELTPDATGTYLPIGPYRGRPSYLREDGNFAIWSQAEPLWTISPEVGQLVAGTWERIPPTIEGEYQPELLAEGVATVTEI